MKTSHLYLGIGAVLLVAIGIGLLNEKAGERAQAKKREDFAKQQEERTRNIKAGKDTAFAKAKTLITQGAFTDASTTLAPFRAFTEPEVRAELATLDELQRKAVIAESRTFLKNGALQQASENIAPYVRKNDADALELNKRILVAIEKDRIESAKIEKAAKRRQGVRIGMTQQDVLESSWGRPQNVNRTTYSWGVKEQWVYGSGNYLYFDDGILKTIQNSR